jgi:hypothetical protein
MDNVHNCDGYTDYVSLIWPNTAYSLLLLASQFSDRLMAERDTSSKKFMFTLFEKTQWRQSVSELYRPSDSRLSTKSMPTFEDRGCREVRITTAIFSVF